MPEIRWIGKKEVLGAVRGAVRLLRGVCGLSAGDDEAGNLLVQGDNLEALRTLLPHYGGRVKCVYIDPFYNTGKEGWKYNDRSDSPQLRRCLAKLSALLPSLFWVGLENKENQGTIWYHAGVSLFEMLDSK